MTKQLTLIEINNEQAITEWSSKLMGEFNKEALESIKRENVTEETVFFLEIDQRKYLGFFIEGEDIKESDQTMPVNQKHRAIMRAINIRRIDSKLLYSLSSKL